MNERSKQRSSTARPKSTNISASRSNLFRSQLTRRPTANTSHPSNPLGTEVEILDDASEIVVRNQQGEIVLPVPPSLAVEELDEQAEARQEMEKERQRLAEAVKRHAFHQNNIPEKPEELLEAVRADLRAKVTALADDNWMFEPEDPFRQ